MTTISRETMDVAETLTTGGLRDLLSNGGLREPLETMSFRIQCECGARFGWGDDLLGREGLAKVRREHASHARDARRREARKRLPETSHDAKVAEMRTPTEREAEKAQAEAEWTRYLRERELPRHRQEIRKEVLGIAARLRSLADDVEKRAQRSAEADADDMSDLVGYTQHDILWAMANLSLDALVRRLAAYTLDQKILSDRQAKQQRDALAKHLGRWVRYGAENGGDAAYHDADGTGWVSSSQGLLTDAEAGR